MAEPQLYVVATPIGNLEDLSYRAVRILTEVDTIACEDTRVTGKLLAHYGITEKRLITCHDHNERNSAAGIVTLIERGESVALCSDAGMPLVNDPGYRVVSAVREARLPVTVIPGPSAVLSALVLSALPPDRFVFLGFPPRKPGQRRNWLIDAARHGCTLILMEAPHRLPEFLAAAAEVYGETQAAVCMEITKVYERTASGPLTELAAQFAEPPRGEAMVVIDGGNIPSLEGVERAGAKSRKQLRRDARDRES